MNKPPSPPSSSSQIISIPMESLPKKRKASTFPSYTSPQSKRKCRGTSPPVSDSPGRGLKRKLGCIDPTTSIGRRQRLDQKYVLGRQIGKGKFGLVRMCHSRASGEVFACKSLAKADETVHREVEIMQHLSGHPGVVTLKAVFEDKEYFHLVMEFCPGGRLLDEMVREGRYSERRAAFLIKELVEVIGYCHEMGVVHRDFKPENILVTSSGKVKLADFGLAVRVTNGQKLFGVAGSPAYVAPEVLVGHYSEKVDVWSAGVLLHALLVGALPFKGNSLEAVFEAIKTAELDFQCGMWKSISKLGRDLISRMLTRDVSARMTAGEVLRHPWILFYTESPSKVLPLRGPSFTEQDCSFVDALAVAISRVKISDLKRSRPCVSASMKANLCTAF